MDFSEEMCVLNETTFEVSNGRRNNNNNNNNHNSRNFCQRKSIATVQSENSCVGIPLADRGRSSASLPATQLLEPQIICIQNVPHPENSNEISRSSSYFVRFRDGFVKFFSKIMGSNTPSEADKYEYYEWYL
ncbi:uncharacterized protein LOC119666406 [Teleopsis dalmanni]|uniref:uncharacterized protein LOC119666406 n=1 Tax=Teleopsis dalmanni TaxID=139649 RepID=UPI0018CD6FFD|nr:uncharacterized protein LOC119666406 [Teleopsis dalmanni]